MKQRSFVAHASALAAAGGVPAFWRRAAAAAAAKPGPDARILVVVELTGGNDGLNMVVPYRDDAYHRARPTLRVAPDKVQKLDDVLGFHPAMTDLSRIWDRGKLRVLMNVGYPKPSRSHFRAMEIWQSGGLEPTPVTGWLGRLSYGAAEQVPPCFVGPGATPLAVRGRDVAPFTVGGVEDMSLRAGARLGPALKHEAASPPVERVARALEAAEAVSGKVAAIRPETLSGERESLEARLSLIRSLIESGFGSRVYYTALDGFDTHAGQKFLHQDLLRKLSAALARFQSDLEVSGLDERVAVLVFSEFGRRLAENGSKGTDHGAAAPVLLLGSSVAGGLHGGAHDLANLDDEDVRFALDLRNLYASVLAGWLGVDPAAVIGRGWDERIRLFSS